VGMGPSFAKTGDKTKISGQKTHTKKKRWPTWFPHLN
jgi:hypothetical protein